MTRVNLMCDNCRSTLLMQDSDCGVRRDGRVAFWCPECGPSHTHQLTAPTLATLAAHGIAETSTESFVLMTPTCLQEN